ncbi:MAG: ferredoxin [Nitrospinota bacterium]
MEHIKYFVFVCIQQRPADHPEGCCAQKASMEILQAFVEEVGGRPLFQSTGVAGATCLIACQFGPTVVVYPDGVWYAGVRKEDVKEIVEEHLEKGRPVERLRLKLPGPPEA